VRGPLGTVAAGRRPIAVFSIWAMVDNTRLYFVTLLNSLTLASLYFIVASGFTLVFGLMRNVNLAHGSLYLLGGYVAFIVAERTGWWILAVAAASSPRRSPGS
jgi:branched-chain amino acid transport system permease protein